MNVLDKWKADAHRHWTVPIDSEATNFYANCLAESENRILVLIDLIERKDEKILYCLGPTRDVKTPHLRKALALNEELK